MGLIFHKFESLEKAKGFADLMEKTHGRKTWLCRTRKEFDKVEVFPFVVKFPVVVIERDFDRESYSKCCDATVELIFVINRNGDVVHVPSGDMPDPTKDKTRKKDRLGMGYKCNKCGKYYPTSARINGKWNYYPDPTWCLEEMMETAVEMYGGEFAGT